YGRDDFADLAKLARTLSRDRAKDMAGDYAVPSDEDRARSFAERREIRWPERAREIVHQVRDKAKDMFAGFRPKPAATPEKAPTPDRTEAAIGGKPDQARAIERYARASADIGRMRAQDLPVLPHQESALRRAGEALDQV
ncbi:Ti-type conjugative transfer relaxase TraA, partial [Listeria monocytogenes]|nr:Ti-type conjugative transfer relaxase TraA [Listeria monocytogenes]